MRPTRMLLGLQAALSITILGSLTYVMHLLGFAQAMVTAIAVLIVPPGLAADSTRQPVMEKMVQRVAGCLLAGVLGVALLPLIQGQAMLCMLALAIGVWTGCHVQTGREGASYVGRQFTIAFIMVFVQDHHWSADPLPALMRLSGILAGIFVLAAVMLATGKLRTSS
ncbi:MAG: FUSC family protein [Paraburkholderia sp.]|uniref:FUSC family protein n=1 Tax=Paraburkholderia sp. TaxID=1926495 RepID=UPI003C410B7C